MDNERLPREVALSEYERLKAEQVERIKQRDSFINFNIIAIGVVAGFLASHPKSSLAWLAVPWICTSFGWVYVMNDEKISALTRYFKHELTKELGSGSLGWESFPRRKTILRRTHKVGQLVIELALYVLPTGVAVVGYFTGRGSRPWFASALAVIEIVGAVALALVIWARSDLVTRFDIERQADGGRLDAADGSV
jgi:hypothetical protein